MRLRAVQYRYQFPLTRPLVLPRRTLDSREGLIVRFSDENGHEGLGEIAPLPGFSRENLVDALGQSTLILDEIHHRDWPADALDSWEDSEIFTRFDSLYHSVSFGLSSALLQLSACRRDIPLHKLIDPSANDRISINALLSGSESEILSRAALLGDQGFRAAKLKVGNRPISDEIELVSRVREILPSSVSLRLDANRRWTFEQAAEFLAAGQNLELEYIEEPVNNIRRLGELSDITKIPIALDESLPEYFSTGMQTRYLPGIFIVKPTLIGGWGRCLKLRDWARQRNIKIVISSSFETAIGLSSLAALASTMSGDIPCGLDTSSWFAADLIDGGLPMHHGTCALSDVQFKWSLISHGLLAEVPRG